MKATNVVYLRDCVESMKEMPDGEFDLAIVDPPYGINASEMTMGSGKNKKWNKGKKWDLETPDEKYFKELFRVSKNQIIWGGNYFKLPISKGWIFWDKGIDGDCSFADGELAWSSFDKVLRKASIRYKGFLGKDKDERIHPTQKPIKLYEWILKNYSKSTDKILDTHVGSGSIRIACEKAGLEFVGFEIDAEYWQAQENRFQNFISQQRLF
jgi:site-specific DNA-methyltransferase (adenine-specific)